MLNIVKNMDNGELTVYLEGKLDAAASRNFEKALNEGLERVSIVTIDCAELEYISSAGLRVILSAQQFLDENDREVIKVINTNEIVTEIFEDTGFTNIINLVR